VQYQGGKHRLAKKITGILESMRKPGQKYIEPFVGACNIVAKMTGEREASDVFPELIAMWKECQKGWIPPIEVSEDEFNHIKKNPNEYPDYLRAFVLIGCAWGGAWKGGNNGYGTVSKEANSGVLKKIKNLMDVKFECHDYRTLQPDNCLIYCDPPYAGMKKYSNKFDHEEFWEYMRCWSRNNTVVISEATAPDDFRAITIFNKIGSYHGTNKKAKTRSEYLFIKIPKKHNYGEAT